MTNTIHKIKAVFTKRRLQQIDAKHQYRMAGALKRLERSESLLAELKASVQILWSYYKSQELRVPNPTTKSRGALYYSAN